MKGKALPSKSLAALLPPSLLVAAAFFFRRSLRRRSDFRGKIALITGGSRGFGLLLARGLAREGATLVLVARTLRDLERARGELEKSGATVVIHACDIGDEARVREVIRDVEQRLGPVDLLINNASIIQVGPFEAMSKADFVAAMDANFWGTFHATQAVLPAMIRSRRGQIVNITSIGAQAAVPHLLPYTTAKYAAFGFSQGLRAELSKYGIRVTTVVPGLMRTGSFVNALFKGKRAAEFNWFSWSSSLPVLSMSAERAAERVLLACRRGEAFVTLGIPARVLRVAYGLLPGFMSSFFGVVNRLLPAPNADADRREPAEPGKLHRGPLGDRAAGRLNEAG